MWKPATKDGIFFSRHIVFTLNVPSQRAERGGKDGTKRIFLGMMFRPKCGNQPLRTEHFLTGTEDPR